MPEIVVKGSKGWICSCCADSLYCLVLEPDMEPDGERFVEKAMPAAFRAVWEMAKAALQDVGASDRPGEPDGPELPFGHPGPDYDDTPVGFDHDPFPYMGQPEPDYTLESIGDGV